MEKIKEQRINTVLIQTLKNNLLSVTISVDPIVDPPASKEQKVYISTIEMSDYLTNIKGFKLKSCLKSAVVSNMSMDSLLGEWLFQLEDKVLFNGLKELDVASTKKKKVEVLEEQ